MPFQIQVIDGPVHGTPTYLIYASGIPCMYETGAQAAERVSVEQRLNAESCPAKRFRIVKTEGDSGDSGAWQRRESSRFETGYYQQVPWSDESWYMDSEFSALHHCHMSRDKTAMVAFTESDDKGRDDKQKRMRPGRYLTKYFSDVIDEIEIRHWAGKLSILVGESDLLQFATTPDDIENVYTEGPHSCMAHEPSHYAGPVHPTRIYGAGDLAVAYIERESSIAARVLCYPANKVYSTVYGDGGVWSTQLKTLLDSAGYGFSNDGDNWDGARLLRIEANHGRGFVVPYFDIPGDATDDGEYLRVARHGEIETATEHGVSEESGRVCNNCNDRYDDENSGGYIESTDQNLCDSCYQDVAFYCDDCDNTKHTDDMRHIEGIDLYVCDSCADSYPTCGDCNEKHKEDSVTYIAARDKHVCESCFEDSYMSCDECGEADKAYDFVQAINGDSICESCAESKSECVECDKHDESTDCFTDSDGGIFCSECRQSNLEFTEPKIEHKSLSPLAAEMESVI